MLDEEVEEPDFVGFELGERFDDKVRYEVGPSGFGGQSEVFLSERHLSVVVVVKMEGCGISTGGVFRNFMVENGFGGQQLEGVGETSAMCINISRLRRTQDKMRLGYLRINYSV
jgi:hypothetical protein